MKTWSAVMVNEHSVALSVGDCIYVGTDIDECTEELDLCDSNANCTNTVGSYTCMCNPGYSGDGIVCSSK